MECKRKIKDSKPKVKEVKRKSRKIVLFKFKQQFIEFLFFCALMFILLFIYTMICIIAL